MKGSCVLVLAFSLLLWYQTAVAQDCLNACELSVSQCTYVNYPVYPVNLNVSANEEKAIAIISQVEALSFFISKECIDQVKRYTCGYFYPSCKNGTNGGDPPTKIKPCRQMCEDVNTACAAYKDALTDEQKQFIDCSQNDEDGTPKFSNDPLSCYSLDNLTPIDRCGNATNGTDSFAKCVEYDPLLSPLTNATCTPFVSREVYYSHYTADSQKTSDTIANATTWLISKLYPVIPGGCYKHLLSLLCQSAYPTCHRVTDGDGTVRISGQPPCHSFCEATLDECSFIFSIIGNNLLNCSSSAYPNTGCSNSMFPINASAPFIMPVAETCPAILNERPKSKQNDANSQCWLPCPDPTYTPHMWRQLNTLILVFSSISFSTMAFLLISSLLNDKKRRRHIHISMYFSCMVQSISFLLNGMHPEKNVWCVDEVTFSTSSTNAACGAQAFLFHLFTLAIACWWIIMAYHMFCTVVLERKMNLKESEKYYHPFAWGLPTILAVIAASTDTHAFGPPNPWCYLHDAAYVNNYNVENYEDRAGIAVDYYVFFMPIGFGLLGAIVMLFLVFLRIYKTLQASKSFREITQADLGVQRRILFLVVLLFIVFVFEFHFRLYLQASDVNQIKTNDLNYVLCMVKNDLGISYDPSCLSDVLPDRINHSYVMFISFLTSSFGGFVFVAFGTEKTIFLWWRDFFKLRSFEDMIKFIKDSDSLPKATRKTIELSESAQHVTSTTNSHKKNNTQTDINSGDNNTTV